MDASIADTAASGWVRGRGEEWLMAEEQSARERGEEEAWKLVELLATTYQRWIQNGNKMPNASEIKSLTELLETLYKGAGPVPHSDD